MKEFVKRIIKFTLCLAVVFMTLSICLATNSPSSQVYAADGDVEINETTFPDANFRQWVIDNIAGGSTTLTAEMIVNTNSIDVRSKQITDLTGIEYFATLTHLQCENNKLTSLDISKNMSLEKIYCLHNQLTTLDVSKNTALTCLHCEWNQLTTLDVSKNTSLKELWCSNNQLTTLDVSKNTILRDLDCGDNKLTALDVSKNTILQRLWFANNRLTVIDVNKNTELMNLNCSSNQLITLDLSNSSEWFYVLYCDNNQLTSINLNDKNSLYDNPPQMSANALSTQYPIYSLKKIGTKYVVDLKQNDLNLDTSKITDFVSNGTYDPTNATVTYDSMPSTDEKITYSYATDAPNGEKIKNMLVEGNIKVSGIYTINYDANKSESGSTPSDTNSYIPDDEVTVLDNNGNLTRKGYEFVGWNTSADGNGTAYKAGDIIKMGDSDITLYAQWTVAIPNTGVTDGMMIYITLIIIALIGTSGLLIYNKKKQSNS